MEVFGGSWTPKVPAGDAEKMAQRKQLVAKLQLSEELAGKIKAHFAAGGSNPTITFSEDGGHYVLTMAMGDMKQDIKFTLDGSETANTRLVDNKAMTVKASFADGVYTSTTQIEGVPPVVITRKRVGDELHCTEECDGVKSNEILIKA